MFLCPRTPLFVNRTTDILMKFVDMDEEEEEAESGVKLHQFHCFEKWLGGGAKSLSDT